MRQIAVNLFVAAGPMSTPSNASSEKYFLWQIGHVVWFVFDYTNAI